MSSTDDRISALEDRLARLEDEHAIARLIASYGPLVDAGEADRVAELWTEEGVYDVEDYLMEGRDQVAAMVRSDAHQGLIGRGASHFLGPAHVSVDGDRAVAVCESVLLVRLAHQFAATDDPAAESQPVTVNLATLFAAFQPRAMVELTLSANEDKATQLANKIVWSAASSDNAIAQAAAQAARLADVRRGTETMTVTLQPMQIRTVALSV